MRSYTEYIEKINEARTDPKSEIQWVIKKAGNDPIKFAEEISQRSIEHSVQMNNEKIFDWCLQNGAKILEENIDGMLEDSIANKNRSIFDKLISSGTPLTKIRSSFHKALTTKQFNLAEEMINHGADLSNDKLSTEYIGGRGVPKYMIKKMIEKAKANVNDICYGAIMKNNEDTVDWLTKDYTIDSKQIDLTRGYYWSIRSIKESMIKKVIEKFDFDISNFFGTNQNSIDNLLKKGYYKDEVWEGRKKIIMTDEMLEKTFERDLTYYKKLEKYLTEEQKEKFKNLGAMSEFGFFDDDEKEK